MKGDRQNAAKAKGMALLLVLWLVAAMSLVVVASVKGIRQHTQLVSLDQGKLRAEVILDGAIQLVAQQMVFDKTLGRRYRWLQLQLGSNAVWLEVTPASGLIDLNVANDKVIQALLTNVVGLSLGDALVYMSRIRDWIDPDQEPGGVGGAEAPQYRASGWPSLPRNAAMEDPTELRAVLGVTPSQYEIIAPFLSLNGQQRIEVAAASPAVIDAMTGQPGLGHQLLAIPPDQRMSILMAQGNDQLFTHDSTGGETDVRLWAYLSDGSDRWWKREVWISLSARPDSLMPWTTLQLESTRQAPNPHKETRP